MRNQLVGLAAMVSALSCQGIPTEDAESQSNNQPGGPAVVGGSAPPYSGCGLFDVRVSDATQWRYAIHWKGDVHGVETIRVERVDGTRIELSTTVRLPEEQQLNWTTSVDCASRRILTQQRSDLALAFWPFPGVFEGQQIDWTATQQTRFTVPPRFRGRPPGSIALTYRTDAERGTGRTRIVRAS